MAKKKNPRRSGAVWRRKEGKLKDVLSLYTKLADLRKEISKLAEGEDQANNRLTSLEIHVNILARLLTMLCIEKLGIRIETLMRFVHRVEKETVRDSQIMELESLYKLSHGKKPPLAGPKHRDDPWDQIS